MSIRIKETHTIASIGYLIPPISSNVQLTVCQSANSMDDHISVLEPVPGIYFICKYRWSLSFLPVLYQLTTKDLPGKACSLLLGLATGLASCWYLPLSHVIILLLVCSAYPCSIGGVRNRNDDNIASVSEARKSLKCRLNSVVIVLGIWSQ